MPEHHALRERDILDAAVDLLRSGRDVTMGAVAERCNLARSSVYEYFPSTEHLIDAAREHRDGTVVALVISAMGMPQQEQALRELESEIAGTSPSLAREAAHIARALLALSAHIPGESSDLARSMAAVERADRENP